MDHPPRISFGMIVLNGEPFLRYNLRSLYPFAHEIIIVEGAVPGASLVATEDGHSIDGTLAALKSFKSSEDPENKIRIIQKDGFWREKDEMSFAYAENATGDYHCYPAKGQGTTAVRLGFYLNCPMRATPSVIQDGNWRAFASDGYKGDTSTSATVLYYSTMGNHIALRH